VVLLVVAVVGFSTHSLSIFSNRVSNELTANGLSSFFQAFRTNQLDYDQFYRTGDPGQMFSLLRKELGKEGGRFTSQKTMDINRVFAADGKGLGKLNVVVIVEESLGCKQADLCGNGLDIDEAIAAKKCI
jgi:hypothetical protein